MLWFRLRQSSHSASTTAALVHLAQMPKGVCRRFVEATSCVSNLFAGASGDRNQFGSPHVTMRDKLAYVVVESNYHMAEQWVSPPRNDVPDTGQFGSIGDLCISDELMPAYIPRIIRRQRTWNASSFLKSSCRSVHASEPYRRMDSRSGISGV